MALKTSYGFGPWNPKTPDPAGVWLGVISGPLIDMWMALAASGHVRCLFRLNGIPMTHHFGTVSTVGVLVVDVRPLCGIVGCRGGRLDRGRDGGPTSSDEQPQRARVWDIFLSLLS
jgi:hypothetical protein